MRPPNPTVNRDLASYRLLVGSLFSSPSSIFISNIVGILAPGFCWFETGLPIFSWFAALAATIVALRAITVSRYLRHDRSQEDWNAIRRWDHEYFLGATAYALVLGLNCFFALACTDNVAAHITTVVSSIAFSSGYVARNAGRPNFVIIQLLSFCIPMVVGLFHSSGHHYQVIGGFIVLYIATNITVTFSINRNLLALAAARKQTEHMAHFDSLTGLANRYTFNEALRKACLAADARNGSVVLSIDLDNFKHINDSLGHEAGDQLLVAVAARLRDLTTQGDVLARLGGDEFVFLHAQDTGRTDDAATGLARRIVDAMGTPFDVAGMKVYVTTSVGVAATPEHGIDPGEVLRASDIALYAAKDAGRNTAAMFVPAMAAALHQRREIENDLREACRSDHLFLHYQPIVRMDTGRIEACEALMRWQHPTKGLVPPDVFIPIAEQTGLIAPMGAWAIRQACMDAASWPDSVAVAVNVSAFQFKDARQLIESVKHALRISQLPPGRLELEVTESLLIEDPKSTLETIHALRQIGVRFSLDDFGTGYSSIGYLARYPFSTVKIDRSFVRNITSDMPSRSIIEAVCGLAARLDLRVVVEGIETEAQRHEVDMLGAELAQGYLFGRPKAIDALVRNGRWLLEPDA